MVSWLSALGVGLAAIGFRSLRGHQVPHSRLGVGVSDAGILVAGLVGGAAGSVGRSASTAVETSILVAGASLATGAGVVIDALAVPLAAAPRAPQLADLQPGARAA